MESKEENQIHITALCKSLGHVWLEDDVVAIREEAPTNKLIECKHTLFGKLLSKPNVNFHAFCNTMKKAWKLESVEVSQKELGFFSFVSEYEVDKEQY